MAGKPSALPSLDEHEELSDAVAAVPLVAAGGASMSLSVDDLSLGEEIGHGAFSRVYRGTFGGAPVAIKRMPLRDKDAVKYLNTELAALAATASHAHLVRYHGAALRGRDVFIVTEFMNGGGAGREGRKRLRGAGTPPGRAGAGLPRRFSARLQRSYPPPPPHPPNTIRARSQT